MAALWTTPPYPVSFSSLAGCLPSFDPFLSLRRGARLRGLACVCLGARSLLSPLHHPTFLTFLSRLCSRVCL